MGKLCEARGCPALICVKPAAVPWRCALRAAGVALLAFGQRMVARVRAYIKWTEQGRAVASRHNWGRHPLLVDVVGLREPSHRGRVGKASRL